MNFHFRKPEKAGEKIVLLLYCSTVSSGGCRLLLTHAPSLRSLSLRRPAPGLPSEDECRYSSSPIASQLSCLFHTVHDSIPNFHRSSTCRYNNIVIVYPCPSLLELVHLSQKTAGELFQLEDRERSRLRTCVRPCVPEHLVYHEDPFRWRFL